MAAAATLIALAAGQVVQAEPPTADFTFSPDAPLVGQPVTFTSAVTDPDGDVAEIAWDFDYDGTTFDVDSQAENPTTAYDSPGTRTVALRVTDRRQRDGREDEVLVTRTVTVQAPPANQAPTAFFAVTPNPAPIGEPVTFDARSSDDPDGRIVRFEWDLDNDGSFGEEGERGEIVTRAFATPGSYPVRLRVTDDNGATSEAPPTSLRVNAPPTATFAIEPLTPVTHEQVTFVGVGRDPDGDALDYSWDFDDDGTFGDERGQIVTRAFATAGRYPVTLRVTDAVGARAEHTRQVTVQNTVPNAGFDVAPVSPLPGEPVTFTSRSSPSPPPPPKTILKQEWDFDYDPTRDEFTPGDVDATGPSVTHIFATPGPKTIGLKVTETSDGTTPGGFDIVARTITVIAPPQTSFGIRPASPFTPAPRPPRLRRLSVDVDISGAFTRRWTRITRLTVRARAGARVTPGCKGRRCPAKISRLRANGKRLRVRSLERRFRPGAKISISVTMPGFIGRHTAFTIRRDREPKRKELCLRPGARRPSPCAPR